MRFFLPLEAVTGSGNILSLTQVSGDYYGPLYFWGTKSAGQAAVFNVYAGDRARDYAVAHKTSSRERAGTLTVPNGAAAWVTITNKTHGPNLKNVKVYCDSLGSFSTALMAYSEEVEFEVMKQMKAILKNYCKADEQLRDVQIDPNKIEIGLRENMTASPGTIGIALLPVLEMTRSPQGFQEYRPNIQITAWVRDADNPEASAQLGARILARLRSIIFDEQRTWGGLVGNTVARELRTMPWLHEVRGTPTRFGEKVRILITLQPQSGHEHEDHIHSVHGGRYASVDLTD